MTRFAETLERSTGRRIMRRAIVILLHCALISLGVWPRGVAAGPQLSVVRGVVLDASRAAIPGATVTLLDRVGASMASVVTDATGHFQLDAVPAGTYTVRAELAARGSVGQIITVTAAWPVDLTLTLTERIEQTVVVEATGDAPVVATRMTLSGETLRQTPMRMSHRALQQVLATLPGWAAEDSGLLHVRGVDDGFLFVQDGVPVYDRLDAIFGIPPDPAGVGSINVLTGYIPAEYGLKAGAVVEVQSPTVRGGRWTGSLDFGGGSDATMSGRGAAGGPLGGNGRLDISVGSERSGRFLDPVHPDNLHNEGGVTSGELHLTLRPRAADLVRMTGSGGRSRYDVPHGALQELRGQDQRQQLTQNAQSGSWQRIWSDTAVSQVTAYRRAISADLQSSPMDTPLSAASDRQQHRTGIRGVATVQRRHHTIKAGVEVSRISLQEHFTFAVTDAEEAEAAEISERAAEFTLADPFVFDDRVARGQWSFFVQDSIRPGNRLTLDLGLRFDRTQLLIPASQWSPRAGAAYSFPHARTVVRASINRFFQPPQPEHLLLSSSAAARALSPFVSSGEHDQDDEDGSNGDDESGGSELHPERQTAWEVGVEKWMGGVVRFDAAYWSRHVRNYADPNVFFGTTIIFPNSVARGLAHGLDLRVEVPRYRQWSGYGSYTVSAVEQIGPINGGLFLEESILEIGPGTRFTPDHDQRHTAAAGLTYQGGRSPAITLAMRHASGTPLEVEGDELDELRDRPGAELVDFAGLRVRPRTIWDLSVAQTFRRGAATQVVAAFSVLNLTGQAHALNFGNPFSGTHFGQGRALRVDVRIGLR